MSVINRCIWYTYFLVLTYGGSYWTLYAPVLFTISLLFIYSLCERIKRMENTQCWKQKTGNIWVV